MWVNCVVCVSGGGGGGSSTATVMLQSASYRRGFCCPFPTFHERRCLFERVRGLGGSADVPLLLVLSTGLEMRCQRRGEDCSTG